MAPLVLPPGLMPSLKDRLLDPDSMGTRERPGYGLQRMVESVREDLEELLNTRQSQRIVKTQYAELARSVVTYGLPDLASIDCSTFGKQEEIGRIMEHIITLHEPRLHNVQTALETSRSPGLSATFHITGEVRVDPAPPPRPPTSTASGSRPATSTSAAGAMTTWPILSSASALFQPRPACSGT